MTTYTYRCPYCNSILERTSSNSIILGNPFRICPHCNKVYTSTKYKEWATLSPVNRFFYYTSTAFVFGLAAFIVLLTTMFCIKATPVTIWLASIGAGIGMMGLTFGLKINKIKREISASIERTKSKSYVERLKNAEFKFYKIKGVEIGTIDDTQHAESTTTTAVQMNNDSQEVAATLQNEKNAVNADFNSQNGDLNTATSQDDFVDSDK